MPRSLGGTTDGADRPEIRATPAAAVSEAFRYLPDEEVYALDLDPRRIRFDLYEGWDREQEAYADRQAMAFVSGPMYERHPGAGGEEVTVPLGDLKMGDRIWRGRNRSAARQRAYLGIRRDGRAEFSYGELTPQRADRYDTFIGGLHSLYNDLEDPPPSYRGAYSISMGQKIRYFLPRIRMVMGLRQDGRLEVLMSRDGLTLEQTRSLARRRGLLAAYMPDHASKSRLIIPGVKPFTEDDANWISGGMTSYVHVPYLLRLSPRARPLHGSLLAAARRLPELRSGCGTPLHCTTALGTGLMDRAMAGLNRVMEQGVEPIARLLWAPSGPAPVAGSGRESLRAPLREPPITADPVALREPEPEPEPEPEAKPEPEPELEPEGDEPQGDASEAPPAQADSASPATEPVRRWHAGAPPPPELPPPIPLPEGGDESPADRPLSPPPAPGPEPRRRG
jgi:hypothetical protein